MDVSKIAQAFSNAGSFASAGIMERAQQKRDIEEWKKRADYSHGLQMDEMEARQREAERVREQEAFRDSLKKDIETNPELQPFVERHIQGDEEATRVLSVYAGSKYKMSKNDPLSSEEIAELAPLPPGVRHTILQGHLTALRKFTDEEADRARKVKADKLTDARIKEITARTEKLERGQADEGAAEAARISLRDREAEIKTRDKAEADLKTLKGNILTISGQLGEKRRQQAQAKGKDQGNYNTELAVLVQKLKAAEEQKARLEGWIRKDNASRLPAEVLPEPEEPEAVAGEPDPELQKFIYGLTDEDRTDLLSLMKARPDLTQDECVQIFQLFKKNEQREKLNKQQRQTEALRIK